MEVTNQIKQGQIESNIEVLETFLKNCHKNIFSDITSITMYKYKEDRIELSNCFGEVPAKLYQRDR